MNGHELRGWGKGLGALRRYLLREYGSVPQIISWKGGAS